MNGNGRYNFVCMDCGYLAKRHSGGICPHCRIQLTKITQEEARFLGDKKVRSDRLSVLKWIRSRYSKEVLESTDNWGRPFVPLLWRPRKRRNLRVLMGCVKRS